LLQGFNAFNVLLQRFNPLNEHVKGHTLQVAHETIAGKLKLKRTRVLEDTSLDLASRTLHLT
jgi:hypothetical protein